MAGLMYHRSSSLLDSHTSMDSSYPNQTSQGPSNIGLGDYAGNASAGYNTFNGGKRQASQPPIFGFYGTSA